MIRKTMNFLDKFQFITLQFSLKGLKKYGCFSIYNTSIYSKNKEKKFENQDISMIF